MVKDNVDDDADDGDDDDDEDPKASRDPDENPMIECDPKIKWPTPHD